MDAGDERDELEAVLSDLARAEADDWRQRVSNVRVTGGGGAHDDHYRVEIKAAGAGTADGPGEPGYVKITRGEPAPPRFAGFELHGDRLVCKCHGQVVLRFDPDALAEYRRTHPD